MQTYLLGITDSMQFWFCKAYPETVYTEINILQLNNYATLNIQS